MSSPATTTSQMRLRVNLTAWDKSNAHSKGCDVSDHTRSL